MTDYLLGVDVASFQGSPAWNRTYGAGYRFAYVKTSQWPGYLNPFAREQRQAAFQAGFTVGNYCYAVAKVGDPVGQAQYFLSHSDIQPWHLVPFLDLEEIGSEGVGPNQLEEFAYTWGREVAEYLGVPWLLLYTDLNMLRNRIRQTARLRKLYKLDVADWTLGPPPKVPGWDVVMHQFRTNRVLPGFTGPVDEDRCLVPLHQIQLANLRSSSRILPAPIPRVKAWQRPQWWRPHL